MFVSFEQKIECSPLLVTNERKKLPPFDQSQIIFSGIYRCCSIYNIFIKYIVFLLWNTIKILPIHGCISINRQLTSPTENNIEWKCSMECKQKVSNSAEPRWRPEIFPLGVWDFSVLPSYRCLILFLTNFPILYVFQCFILFLTKHLCFAYIPSSIFIQYCFPLVKLVVDLLIYIRVLVVF
jgi:hypothetical protein